MLDLLRDARPVLRRRPAVLAAAGALLEPFRIANAYGLFAVMTRARYEIEFQGSRDGATWIAYPFRYKPQDLRRAAGDLRALSAALRMEPLVRLARRLAAATPGW